MDFLADESAAESEGSPSWGRKQQTLTKAWLSENGRFENKIIKSMFLQKTFIVVNYAQFVECSDKVTLSH